MPRALLLLLPTLAMLGCATPSSRRPAALPASLYRTVHVDTPAPSKMKQFVDARHEWLQTLAAKMLTDGRGFYLQVDNASFLSLRPFTRFAELDDRGARAQKVAGAAGQAAGERYDTLSDQALIPPHRSEIWRKVPELEFPGADPRLSELSEMAARMVVEEIGPSPESNAAYEEAWRGIRAALEASHYPLTRVTFISTFGTGHFTTFWLAHTREELAAVPSVEDTVRLALGRDKADLLFRKLAGAVTDSKSFAVISRPDMSSP